MNRIFRLVFNRALGQVQVVSELACRARAGHDARPSRLPLRALLAIALAFASGGAWAQALPEGQLPTGETVLHGSASFDRTAANLLQITQNGRTVIDWSTFDIGTAAHVNFVQSAGSIALNRVTGGTASQILGRLDATAGIFLINPSGVLFGSGAQVNVGSLMASTLGLGAQFDGDPRDPLLRFAQGDNQINLVGSAPAAVVNHGMISTRGSGGSISLIGATVVNSDNATLRADQGQVNLVGAGRVDVSLVPSHQVSMRATTAPVPGTDALVNNAGLIAAAGGTVVLTGAAALGTVTNAVNTTGIIAATSLGGEDGRVVLRGVNGGVHASGAIVSSGNIGVSSDRQVTLSGLLDSSGLVIQGASIAQVSGHVRSADTRLTAYTSGQGGVQAGDITLNSAGNVLGGNTFFYGRNVALSASSGINVGGGSSGGVFDQPFDALRATGNLQLNVAGDILQTGAIAVDGTTGLEAGGRIRWNQVGNRFAGPVTLASGGAAEFAASGALTLAAFDHDNLVVNAGAVTLGGGAFGALSVSASAGDIRQTGALTVGGASRFDASAAVVLDTAGNSFDGVVALYSGAQSQLASSGALTLGTLQVGGPLTVSGSSLRFDGGSVGGTFDATASSGDITQTGALSIGGASDIEATGAVALSHAGNDFAGAVNVAGAGINLHDANDLTLASVAGAANGAVTLSAGDNLTLPLSSIDTGAGALDLSAGGSLTTGAALRGGTVRLHGGSGLTLSHDVAASGTLSLSSAGAINQTAGTLSTPVLTISAQRATLAGSNAIAALGNLDVADDLTLRSTQALTQRADSNVRVGGAAAFDTGNQNLALFNATNDFQGIVSLRALNAQLRNSGNLRLGTVEAASLEAVAPELRFSTDISTQGLQSYAGQVILDRDLRLQSQLGQIRFNGAVDGAYTLTLENLGGGVFFAGPVGGTTALASLDASGTSASTLGGDITATGDVAFSRVTLDTSQVRVRSTAGDITTGLIDGMSPSVPQALTLSAAGDVSVGQVGSDVAFGSLTIEGAKVSTGSIFIADGLSITASAGDITQGGRYAVGGDSRFNATGDIRLDNTSNTFAGDVALNGGNAVINAASTLRLDGVDVASLTANSGAHALTLRNAAVAGGASLVGSGVRLDGFGVGGNLDITSGASGVMFGTGQVDGDLLGTSSGGITQDGAIEVGNATTLEGGEGIVLTDAGNRFGGDVRAIAGGDIDLRGRGTMRVTGANAGTDADVSLRAGTLDLRTAIDAGQGALTLESDAGALNTAHALRGGAVTLQGRDGITSSADVTASGPLALSSAAGSITQTGGTITAGAATLDASGDIVLGSAGNDFGGAVSVTGRDVLLRDANTLTLGPVSARSIDIGAATIQLGSDIATTGDQAWRGDLQLTGDVALDSSAGDIGVTGAVDSAGGAGRALKATAVNGEVRLAQTIGGNSALSDLTVSADTVALGGGIRVDDALVITAARGDITQSAAFMVGGDTRLVAGDGDILMTHAGNDFGGTVDLDGAQVAIADVNALRLGTVDAAALTAIAGADLRFAGANEVAGTLIVAAGGAIVQDAGSVIASQDAGFTAGGDIRLTGAGNDFRGTVDLDGMQVAIADSGALHLGTVNANALTATAGGELVFSNATRIADTLSASSDGAIAQTASGGIEAQDASFVAGGDIRLAEADNDFRGTIALEGAQVAIADRNALTLARVDAVALSAVSGTDLRFDGPVDLDGGLDAHAGGAISQGMGAAIAAGDAMLVAGGDITLVHAGNDLRGTVDLDGTRVAIADVDALRLGTVNATALTVGSGGDLVFAGAMSLDEDLTATAAGTISQTAAGAIAARDAQLRAAGDITLGNVGNDFTGTVTLDGARITIADANALRLGAVDADALTAAAGTGLLFAGATDVEGALLASAGGSIGQTAEGVITSEAAGFTAAGDISLTHADNDFGGPVSLAGRQVTIVDANALQLGTVDAAALTATAGTTLGFTGAVGVDGALVANATGTIAQTAAGVIAAQDASFTTAGDIALDNAGNHFRGTVGLAGEQVAIRDANALRLGAIDVGALRAQAGTDLLFAAAAKVDGALDATAGGTIRQSVDGMLTVGGDTALAAGGDIVLANANNVFGGGVALDGATVELATADTLRLGRVDVDALDVQSGGSLTFAAATRVADALVATSDDTIGQTVDGTISAGGDSRFVASGAIDLSNAGNDFAGAVSLDGNTVSIHDANALTLGAVDADTLDVRSHGALVFDATRVGGALTAHSDGGAIAQTGALAIGGTSIFDSGAAAVTLNNPGNVFGDTVTVTGGAVEIAATGVLSLGEVDVGSLRAVAGSIALRGDVSSDDDQDYVGDLRLEADVLLASGGDVTVSGTTTGTHTLSVDAGGHAGFGGAVALAGLAIDAGSASLASMLDIADALSIRVQFGGIGQSGAFRVGGAAAFDANGGAIALTDAGNDFAGRVDLTGGDVAIRDANALSLGTVDAGTLDVGSGGALDLGTTTLTGALVADSGGHAITQSGALVVGGASDVQGGDITLTQAGNDFVGAASLTGDTVVIADRNALTLGTVRAGTLDARIQGALQFGDVVVDGTLVARSQSGGIGQSGALRAGGTSTLDAGGGDVVLDHAGNDFVGAVDVAGGSISLRDANDLVLSHVALGIDGDVRLVAGRALSLPTQAIDAGTGSVHLSALGGALTTRAAIAGGEISLQGAGGIALGHDVDADGTLALDSGGDIIQSGGRIAAGTLTGTAAGTARLEGANRIGTLGAFTGNGVRLANAQTLTVDGPLSAGNALHLAIDGDLSIGGRVTSDDVRLETTGGITQSADGAIVARTLSGRAGGAVMLGNATTVTGNQIERIGDFTARSGFSMTNGRSLTLTSLNGSRFTIDAGTSNFYLAVVGDLFQDGTDWLYNGRGTWAATGGIGQSASPIYVTGLEQQTVAALGRAPAYFYALRPDGSLLPVVGESSVNIPTSVWAGRAQSSSNRQVAYVDVGADASNYRSYGVVEPGIRLPADQTPECDPDFPSDACVEAAQ